MRIIVNNMFPQSDHVEIVVLSGREFANAKDHVYIDYEPSSDIEFLASTASYTEIRQWVSDNYNDIKVSSLYVAEIKQKHRIIERVC